MINRKIPRFNPPRYTQLIITTNFLRKDHLNQIPTPNMCLTLELKKDVMLLTRYDDDVNTVGKFQPLIVTSTTNSCGPCLIYLGSDVL